MAACQRLHQRDQQPAYLWNALEVACRTPLAGASQYELLGELSGKLGEAAVRRKVMTDAAYEAVRPAFAVAAETATFN
jgi:hypothetical protein